MLERPSEIKNGNRHHHEAPKCLFICSQVWLYSPHGTQNQVEAWGAASGSPAKAKPFNPELSKIVEQKTQEMLKDKVIEPTKPEPNMWNSRVVLVPKKAADGSWLDVRMCINYRPANAVTEPDSYPIGDCREPCPPARECCFQHSRPVRCLPPAAGPP